MGNLRGFMYQFFHVHATINHRKNTIVSLTDDDSGEFHSEHEQKAKLL